MDKSCVSRFLTAVVVIGLVGSAFAQTLPPPTSNPCPSTAAPTLASFSVERVVDPAQILSTTTPTIPASIAMGVQNKVLEIHETMMFDSNRQVLTLNLFPMQVGSTIPTAPGGVMPGAVFSTIALKVDTIKTACAPQTSVMFIGTIAANASIYPFGNVAGAPAAVYCALTNDTPPMIKDVVELQAGIAVLYSPAGAGTVTFTTPPVTPPTPSGGPTAVVNAPTLTTISSIDLDASASKGNNLPLTFHWSVVAGTADIANPAAAKATGYLLGSVGTYTFRVTVTDSKGNVSTKDVTVQYL